MSDITTDLTEPNPKDFDLFSDAHIEGMTSFEIAWFRWCLYCRYRGLEVDNTDPWFVWAEYWDPGYSNREYRYTDSGMPLW